MSRPPCLRVVSAAAAALVLGACSTWVPVTAPAPGATVRARLTVEEAVRWSELRGEPVRTLQGRVVGVGDDGLALDVLLVRSPSRFRGGEFRDTLTIPAAGLESVAVRRVSPWRTALLVAGTAAAGWLLVDEVLVGGDNEGGGGDGGGTQASVIPLLRIPLGP